MPDYPGSLTDSEWEFIRPLLPASPLGQRGRPREHSRHSILNGNFCIIRTGGARLLLAILTTAYGWLKRIWADGGYSGQLEGEVARLDRHRQIDLEIVKRSDDVKGFKVLPKRWIVERTFGWLIQSRRLIRDHEVRIEHSEALIYLSMTKRMLARIAA